MVNPTIISHPLWCGQMWLTNLVSLQWPAQVHRKTAQMQNKKTSLAFGPIHPKNVEAKPVSTNPSPEQTRKIAQLRRLWNLPWGEWKTVPGGGVPRERKTVPRGTSPREPFSAHGNSPGPFSKTTQGLLFLHMPQEMFSAPCSTLRHQ